MHNIYFVNIFHKFFILVIHFMEYLKRAWEEININNLIQNTKNAQKVCDDKLMAIVKADAYGCGAVPVSKVIQSLGVNWFGVSNIQEALELRENGINGHILILGYTPPECAPLLTKHNISQAIFSYDYAYQLMQYSKGNIKIHIKLDTGMTRIGFDCRDENFLEFNDVISVLSFDCFEFEGIFTHFSTADCNEDFNIKQYDLFKKGISAIKSKGYSPIITHCCNSTATYLHPKMHNDLCRVGISLYCKCPLFDNGLSKDIVTLKSVVSMVKTIRKGDPVSYGRNFVAEKDMTVATVTAGYDDGYRRALSNKAYVLINGQQAKVLGNVCMDQFVVDITDFSTVNIGDEVLLFGGDIPVYKAAALCDTISYEILCGVTTKRVPRVYVYNDKEYSANEISQMF